MVVSSRVAQRLDLSVRIIFSSRLHTYFDNDMNHKHEVNVVRSHLPDVALPIQPIHSFVWENIDRWNNMTAIECTVSGRSFKYGELRQLCHRFKSSLKKLGLGTKNCISIILPNTPEFAISYLGALELGLKVNLINPFYNPGEIQYQLENSDSDCVICHASNLHTVQTAIKKIKRPIHLITTPDFNGSDKINPGVYRLTEMIEEANDDQLDCRRFDIESTALIAYSSGTTGSPKGTCLSHRSITANLAQLSLKEVSIFRETDGTSQVVVPAVIPFFHCYGNILLLLLSLRSGAKIITIPKFDATLFTDLLLKEKEDITLLAAPPLVFFLGSSPMVQKKHLEGINKIYSSAAPCAQSDVDQVQEKHHVPIIQVYGLTETCGLTMFQGGSKRHNPIGYLLPNTMGKTIDINNSKNNLSANQSGELCFRGPQLMKGYLKNEEATKQAIDEDGWFHTGDVGHYDENGCFYITDRLKELIKVNGFQVAPAELEEVLRQHPAVYEAGVVGIKCPKTGETPVAFVSLIDKSIKPLELMKFSNEKLSKHKNISKLFVIDTIPKTASGKILRKSLKKLAEEESTSA